MGCCGAHAERGLDFSGPSRRLRECDRIEVMVGLDWTWSVSFSVSVSCFWFRLCSWFRTWSLDSPSTVVIIVCLPTPSDKTSLVPLAISEVNTCTFVNLRTFDNRIEHSSSTLSSQVWCHYATTAQCMLIVTAPSGKPGHVDCPGRSSRPRPRTAAVYVRSCRVVQVRVV